MLQQIYVVNEAGEPIKKTFVDLGPKKYYLGKTIGEGTYSKVCMALMKITGENYQKNVACKIINRRRAGSDFTQKFLPRELRVLRTIRHPNIVTVSDIIDLDQCVYIFMTYCKYGDLLEYIRNRGELSERRSKFLFRQIVSAINYLHQLDIAHRDLKCENIFLSSKNHIKLGDFGFARICQTDKQGNKQLSNTFCGSAAYAAPEIIQGQPYDPKMYDIWSVGCILYIMLTAQMPFDDSNVKRMLKFQQNRVICFSICYSVKFSGPLKKLLIQLLEPDVKRRVTIVQVAGCNWLMDVTNGTTLKNRSTKKK